MRPRTWSTVGLVWAAAAFALLVVPAFFNLFIGFGVEFPDKGWISQQGAFSLIIVAVYLFRFGWFIPLTIGLRRLLASRHERQAADDR